MSIQLPGELADLLNELGYTWPKSDEGKMFQLGADWVTFSNTLTSVHEDATAHARQVGQDNSSTAVRAFLDAWSTDDNAPATLSRGVGGAQVIGGALELCSGVVLALKVNVIVQLTMLFIAIIQAIVSAFFTGGASLAEIPAVKKLTDIAINFLINKATEAILG